MKPICFYILLLGWYPASLPAQEFFYTNTKTFDSRDGYRMLEKTWYITQDNRGLLWIGGDNGLCSFDGTHFKNYRHRRNDSTSLPANHVLYNYQDRHGVYWVAVPNKGLFHFNPKTGTFQRFGYRNEMAFNIHSFNPNLPFETKNGDLYFPVPYLGIVKYDREQNTMVPYKICPPGSCGTFYNTSHISRLAEDPNDGTLWAVTNDGLVHFFPENGRYTVYRDKGRKTTKHLMTQVFTTLYFDGKRALWIGTWGYGLKRFDRESNRFEEFLWYNGSTTGTRNICEGIGPYDEENLWVNTLDAGLLQFNTATKKFLPVRKSGEETTNLLYEQSFQNKNGVLWLANVSRLARIHPAENHFAYRDLKRLFPAKSIANWVYAFTHQKQRLYLALHHDGFFGEYDLVTGKLLVHPAPDSLDKGLRYLAEDKAGRIWLAGDRGIAIFHPRTRTFTRPKPPPAMPDAFALLTSVVLHDSDGTVWLGTEKGLLHYYPLQDKVRLYANDMAKGNAKDKKYATRIYSLHRDKNGNIWFGNGGVGLGCLQVKTGQVIFFNKHRNPDYPESVCTSISEAKDGSILYALQHTGLSILKNPFTKDENIQVLTSEDGLPADEVYRVFTDRTGNTWLFTPNGLAWLDLLTKQCRRFGPEEGLAQPVISSKPYQDSKGRIYIGTNTGFHWFHPQALQSAPAREPNIHLSSLTIGDRDWPINPDFLSSLRLNHQQSALRFSFATLSPDHITAIQYAYKLDGFEKNWHHTGTHTTGQYTNLSPGRYTLRIRAMNNSGAWNKKEFALPITITPPWYATSWFYLSVGLLVAAGVYLFFRYRLTQVRREERLLAEFNQRLAETEMKALRAQMNPHFIFNCLNSIHRYVVKSDHQTAASYLTKFAKLIRLILDNSSGENITLEKELQTLELYLQMEVLRFDDAFRYEIEVDTIQSPDSILLPSMLLQPYVENAIWHGLLHKRNGEGQLWLRFQQTNGLLAVEIEDNGIGREKARALKSKDVVRKKSYGMQISKDRIALLNELYDTGAVVKIIDLKSADGTATGTRVHIELPVKETL